MYKKILIPLDLEETHLNKRAIAVAEDLAQRYGAKLTALTTIPDLSAQPLVASFFPDDADIQAYRQVSGEFQRLVDQQFERASEVSCAVVEGSPRKAILRYARDRNIDLIVMPARKSNLSSIVLGSNSSYVVHNAACSVLIVRAETG